MASRISQVFLPDDLLKKIDQLVGERGRSAFLTELAEREVHRLRLIELLERPNQPGWNLEEHPELKGGAAEWVSQMRQEDERIDSETESQ